MDEATSNLDTITENAIKNTIFNLSDDISCVIIAHRLSTIRNCDMIYVMDNGKVIEEGSHDELIGIIKCGLHHNYNAAYTEILVDFIHQS